MFLRAANAGGEVLKTVHVEAAAAVAGGLDAVGAVELLHSKHHVGFIGAVVFAGFGGGGLGGGVAVGKERRGGVGNGHGGLGGGD